MPFFLPKVVPITLEVPRPGCDPKIGEASVANLYVLGDFKWTRLFYNSQEYSQKYYKMKIYVNTLRKKWNKHQMNVVNFIDICTLALYL